MTGDDARRAILDALRAEVRRHWGEIGRREERLEKSGGYLSRIARGAFSPPLDVLLGTLDAFDLEPASFFGHALDVTGEPEHFLRDLEARGGTSRRYQRLAAAARGLGDAAAGDEDKAPGLPTARAAELAAELAEHTAAVQQRRLRSGRRYRDAGFAAAYLDHLDALRQRRPDLAARLAETVVTALLPEVGAASRPRLLCRALGVYASAQRLRGELALAASALRLALELGRRRDLPAETAAALQRGAYVLSQAGRHRRALALLREALEIYFDREALVGVGKTLVDRGIVFRYAGADLDAVRVLRRARQCLPWRPAGALERNYEALYHHLIQACAAVGDDAGAERFLAEAGRRLDGRGAAGARLLWQRGRLLAARGDARAAEEALRRACLLFDRDGDPEGAVATLDLLLALLAQGRAREARELARQRLATLAFFCGNGLTRPSLDALERAVLDDRLGPPLIERLAGEIQRGRARRSPRR